MQLEPIRPLEYITDRDPIPEEVMDTSSWFKTETMELNVGEYVGRPNAAALFHTSFIMPLLAEGWYIDAVLGTGENGTWISKATAQASQNGSSNSSSQASSESSSDASSSARTTSQVIPTQSEVYSGYKNVNQGDTSGSSKGSNKGSSKSSGSGSTSGSSTTTTTQEGTPWWYAYQKLRLKRRKMQSELVLKDMISSFTKAYNEGRQINDERYDELVALYALMLQRTENEANAFGGLSTEDFKPLADAIIAACKDAMEKYAASADNIPEDWMQSRIDEINRKFDALLAQAKNDMVSKGTYNSTVWPTTASGIERDRQNALSNLKDDMVTLKVDVYGKIAAMKADIGHKLLDCEIRIIEAQQKMLLGPTEIRNTVFKWMLDFMERREDDYPGLEQLATIASQLGYAEGGAAGAGTVA